MKKVLLISLSLLIAVGAFTQEEEEFRTISGGKKVKVRGFAGPMMSFTTIGDDFAFMMGGGGGVLVGNFFFGGYGMGQTVEIVYPYPNPKDDDPNEILSYGHGGFWTGYVFMPKRAIHPTIHVTTGWGSIDKENDNDPPISSDGKFQDDIFVISPTLELEANISRFFRTSIGVNYSYITGLQTTRLQPKDFQKPGVFVSFKFGWFD